MVSLLIVKTVYHRRSRQSLALVLVAGALALVLVAGALALVLVAGALAVAG